MNGQRRIDDLIEYLDRLDYLYGEGYDCKDAIDECINAIRKELGMYD